MVTPPTLKPDISFKNVGKIFVDQRYKSNVFAAKYLLNPFNFCFSRPISSDNSLYLLNDISFSLDRNDTLGIVGSRSSGIHLISKLAAGLILPDRGEVKLNAFPLFFSSPGKYFKPMLTVWENTRFGLALHTSPKIDLDEKCREVLDLAQLTGKENTPFYDLERGVARRLLLDGSHYRAREPPGL